MHAFLWKKEEYKNRRVGTGDEGFMTLSPVSTRRFSLTSCLVRIRKMNDLVAFIDGQHNARYELE